jgi:hypothetical protein
LAKRVLEQSLEGTYLVGENPKDMTFVLLEYGSADCGWFYQTIECRHKSLSAASRRSQGELLHMVTKYVVSGVEDSARALVNGGR